MKILLTENQINRIVLSESSDGYKILYSDKFLELYVFRYNSKKASVVPSRYSKDDDTEISGGISNLTTKPIIFTFNKSISSGLTYFKFQDKELSGNNLSTLNLSIVIPPYDIATFRFKVVKTKEDFFIQSFGFYYTQPESQPIYKTIGIPISVEPIISICEKVINQTHLNSAISWWKKWLNNSATKARFAKSFKYDKNTVEKHFTEYNKILGQIKYEYTLSDRPSGGWVFSPPWKKGYNIPITINCKVAKNYGNEDSVSFFIHEIQHILDSYHKFHPYESNILSYAMDGIMSDFGPTKKIDSAALVKYLISVGFGPKESESIITYYNLRLTTDEIHLKNPNEVMSSLSEIRRALNLTPNEKITKELLISNYDNDEVMVFIHQWLYSGKSLNNFLNFSNSIAIDKDTNRNLA